VDIVIGIVVVLAVVGFIAFKKRDKLMGLLNKPASQAGGSAPGAQAQTGASAPGAQAAEIDYAFWAQWTRYDLETLQFSLRGGMPAGFDWRRYEAARGAPDGSTHTNNGTKIEAQEGRQYEHAARVTGDHGDKLIYLPGTLSVSGASRPLRLSVSHGAQSKGLIYAVVNGGSRMQVSQHLDLDPGDSFVVFEGEPEGKGIAVAVRPR
jgi:hypothetical protein